MTSHSVRRGPARPRRIYVPVLHGIGTRDHRDWALASVGRIAAHLRAGGTWRETPCPAGCADYADGHRHVVGPGEADAVLDPLSWFSAVPEPTRRDAAFWLIRALFLLCCVHLLVNAQAILSGVSAVRITFRRPAKALIDVVGALWRTLRGMMWILVIASATALGLVIGPPVVMLSARARELVADALAWTSTGASRDAVLAAVGDQMRRPRSDHVLLVGHSQGGAIAAAVARALPERTTTLLTLGSGLALLAAVRAAADVRGRVLFAFAAAIVAYVAVAAVVIRQIVVGVIAAVGLLLLALTQIAGALWATTADSPRAASWHLTQLDRAAETAMSLAARLQPDPALLLAAVPLAAMAIAIYRVAIHPIATRVIAECRIDAPGLDLSAVFDPVSHPLVALGSRARARRITQAASLADHLLYFPNRIEVLRAVEAQLTDVATGSSSAPALLRDDLTRESRLATHVDRLGRAAAAAAVMALAPAIWPQVGIAGAVLAGIAAYALGTALKQRRWRRRQRRATARLLRHLRCRPARVWIHAALTFAGAMVMLGAATSPARPDEPAIRIVAAIAYALLAVGVPAALGRSTWAPWILSAGLAASAVVWIAELTFAGVVAGLVALVLAIAYAATQARRLARSQKD